MSERDEFERYMDEYQTVLALKVGEPLTDEQLAAIRFCDEYVRGEEEHAITVFHRGFEMGLLEGGGDAVVKMSSERDEAVGRASVAKALGGIAERTGFVRGAQACREMMARFVEQGGDATTAGSIRANWHPGWGEDPGAPDEIAAHPERHTAEALK